MHQSNPNIQIVVEINSSVAVAPTKAIKTCQHSMHYSNPNIQIAVEINSCMSVAPTKAIKSSSVLHAKAIQTFK